MTEQWENQNDYDVYDSYSEALAEMSSGNYDGYRIPRVLLLKDGRQVMGSPLWDAPNPWDESEVELEGFDLAGDKFAAIEDIDKWRLPTRTERELWVQHKDPFEGTEQCDNSK